MHSYELCNILFLNIATVLERFVKGNFRFGSASRLPSILIKRVGVVLSTTVGIGGHKKD